MICSKTLSLNCRHLGCFAVRPYIPLVFNLSLYTFNRLECYRGRLVLNLQKSWMIRCKGVLDGTLQAVVLNLQTSWMQSCKILFLNYKHHWCFGVRSRALKHLGRYRVRFVLNFRSSLMLRCQIAAWSCNHLGCYRVRFCPYLANLCCYEVGSCP